jgi:ubiquinone biosynthesis protein Coq4
MGMMESEFITDELAPLVKGIYEGEDLFFIHTEASDPDVANVLTEMMGPQVITVPGLADIPKELLGNVYVFTNGVMGGGPMGFQPDVFDSIPGDNEYTPLRMIHFITWQDQAAPRILNSVAEIEAAELEGEIEIERSDIVVNMPILVWPGGHR